MENDLLNHLIEKVNKSNVLKVEYGITGQKVKYDENNKVCTFSENITMEVNYIEKTATRKTIQSDFDRTIIRNEIYENNMKISDDLKDNQEFTKDEFENLFKPGNLLYPLYLQELIPVNSQMNNKYCQVCIPSDNFIKNIKGHIKSTYAIYRKEENIYDITMIMSQKDKETEIQLMQYCNIIIYI